MLNNNLSSTLSYEKEGIPSDEVNCQDSHWEGTDGGVGLAGWSAGNRHAGRSNDTDIRCRQGKSIVNKGRHMGKYAVRKKTQFKLS